jgi:hypothetical protein
MEEDVKTEATPPTPTAIVIRNRDGKIRTGLRDEAGKFVRTKPRSVPDSREIKKVGRKFLMEYEADESGKITKRSKTRLRKIVDTAYKHATYDGEDAKMVGAAKQWADWLMLYFVGKPGPMDEDREEKGQGIQFVIGMMPELPNKEVIDEHVPPSKPTFAKVVSVETNPVNKE